MHQPSPNCPLYMAATWFLSSSETIIPQGMNKNVKNVLSHNVKEREKILDPVLYLDLHPTLVVVETPLIGRRMVLLYTIMFFDAVAVWGRAHFNGFI